MNVIFFGIIVYQETKRSCYSSHIVIVFDIIPILFFFIPILMSCVTVQLYIVIVEKIKILNIASGEGQIPVFYFRT